jgi:hypothetical protein
MMNCDQRTDTVLLDTRIKYGVGPTSAFVVGRDAATRAGVV